MPIRTQQLGLQRYVVGQQREGNDAAVLAEVLARVAGLDRRIGRAEFLSVDAAVENLQVKRVVRKNGQLGDEIADLVVRRFQRGQTQVLLMGGFQDVIRNALVSAILRLPWFIAWAMITAMRLSSSAIFFA